MWFTLLILPIVLIFSCLFLYLAGKATVKWCRSGWLDAGPWMFWCRSSDAVMQVPGCANFRDKNTVGDSRITFGIKQCYRLNMWTIIQPLKSFSWLLKRGSTQKWKLNQLRGSIYWLCHLFEFFPASFFRWPERLRLNDAGPGGLMQVQMFWCRSTDGVMQVHGWCDAGLQMVRCRSTDGAMQVSGCANFGDGNTVVESRNTFGKNQSYRLNMWAIIQPLKSFHFWVDPLFKPHTQP